jgi:hypothetical protein
LHQLFAAGEDIVGALNTREYTLAFVLDTSVVAAFVVKCVILFCKDKEMVLR